MTLTFVPVDRSQHTKLDEFLRAFGKFRYCSCMRWRLTSSEFKNSTKEGRTQMLKDRVDRDEPLGVLALDDERAAAWISVAPRDTFRGLERYKALARFDSEAVWSMTCMFVAPKYRRHGVTERLINAGVEYAQSCGAAIVEAYPVEPDAPSYTYMGTPKTLERCGFSDVTPEGRTRRIYRRSR
ncbi:MAG: GNAT family N-acetyltransferase [Myxococcota bacterium]